MKIDVLDHGFVRLVSYMQPASDENDPGGDIAWTGDLEVVRNARTSFNADWRTGVDEGADAKLLGRMLRHNHSSPFESMVFTFEVQAPIFVLRQWHRHRTWSYNEVSGRYAPVKELYYIPEADTVGIQSKKNKQQRDLTEATDPSTVQMFRETLEMYSHETHEMYNRFLAQGIPRELARLVLSLNTYSRMFATVDLHNLMHFLKLRLAPDAQWEIRQYAAALRTLVQQVVPETISLWSAFLPFEPKES